MDDTFGRGSDYFYCCRIAQTMPVLTDLEERLQRSPFDADAFRKRFPMAASVAERMHLVHVTGAKISGERWNAFISIVTEPPRAIPTSENLVYCTDDTRRAEDAIGFPRSVHFYAGRAHPAFGSVAVVFGPGCQQGHSGSATPFDTGGFVWQPVPPMKVRLVPNDELPQRISYCRKSELSLDEWRQAFARFLAAYFDKSEDYWTGRPSRPDPEGLYELNDDWRCWAFEIRFAEAQPIHDRVAWCADESVMQALFRLHNSEPNAPGEPRPVHRFLNNPPALKPSGTPFYCKAVENWVMGQLGI
jgi:hypothetical protein